MNRERPDNWLDKIFDLLEQFYGERWTKQFSKSLPIDLYKLIWFNGLNRLSYDQLRHGLVVAKKYASNSSIKPPTVVKFYHYCIGLQVPNVLRRTFGVKN